MASFADMMHARYPPPSLRVSILTHCGPLLRGKQCRRGTFTRKWSFLALCGHFERGPKLGHNAVQHKVDFYLVPENPPVATHFGTAKKIL